MSASTRTAALSHGGRKDPTQTTTIRRRYAQRLRGALGEIMAAARRGIVEKDIFRLKRTSLAEPPDVFRFPTDDKKIEGFMEWLRRQVELGVLSIISTDENQFIQAAYGRGLEHAASALREAGIDVPDQPVTAAFNLPIHREALQLLFTRNYQQLEGITQTMGQQISRELTEGFSKGENARTIARRVSDRVQKVGKTRATVLARTEVVNAHSEATLNRYERFSDDMEGVTVRSEWDTAGDERVCEICQALEERVMSVDEAREETFTFEGQQYPIRPPSHPQCRCVLTPVVSE